MKKIMVMWLVLSSSVYGETKAFSPSIPGQPLIFHKTKPTVSPFESQVLRKLTKKQLIELFALADINLRLSQDFLGLVGNIFLPVDKQNVSALYNRDIDASISLIDQVFLSLGSSKKIAHLVNQTLINFVRIANQMLADSIDNPSNQLFHLDYQQMQIRVINYFQAGLEEVVTKSPLVPTLKAEAISSLNGLVSCLSLYISGTDSLVEGGNSAPMNMVLARQQVTENLTNFVESTFALQAITLNGRCCCCHGK